MVITIIKCIQIYIKRAGYILALSEKSRIGTLNTFPTDFINNM